MSSVGWGRGLLFLKFASLDAFFFFFSLPRIAGDSLAWWGE